MEVLSLGRFGIFHHGDENIISYGESVLPLSTKPGHEVRSYKELLKKIAALTYHNSRFKILFRGQRKDYKLNSKGEPSVHSSLYPSILRHSPGMKREKSLDERFCTLRAAEELLKKNLRDRVIHQNQIVRWAILQHYEVCSTPLLDLTQSLETALSFAIKGDNDEGYLFALAFPQLTGPISVSIESFTQVIDLTQYCPPIVLRPHFQKGILAGDYPVVDSKESSHGKRGMLGNNFSCRLLTKFRLTNCLNWVNEGFTPIRDDILFPNADDKWYPVIKEIRSKILTHKGNK